MLPIAVTITVFINVFFVFTKGAAKTLGADFTQNTSAWLSAAIAGGCGLFTAVVVVPLLRRRSASTQAKEDAEAAAALEAAKLPAAVVDVKDVEDDGSHGKRTW